MDAAAGESPSPPPAPSRPLRLPPVSYQTPPLPSREDCWSEDATYTLIEAWGDRYRLLDRGNLRQQHWQEVAAAVNAHHGHVRKARRTDVQCKNRIDTLKKKYKLEKARVLESNGEYVSTWPFFSGLDSLIGSSFKPSPAVPIRTLPPASVPVPVAPRSKRPAPAPATNSFFRHNFSAIAAAAAAAAAEEEEDESDTSRSRSTAGGRRDDGDRRLAEAIVRLGEIYERVEESKQRQMMELEKQRMQFARDLEIQRMKLFMDSQIQLERIKRLKGTS